MTNPTPQEGKPASVSPTQPQQIRIKLKESDGFRVLNADGVWFGGDPQKRIHLNFYQDRFPLADEVQIGVDAHGKSTGSPSNVEPPKGVVYREIGVDVVMTLEAATKFHEFLGKNIETFKKESPK